MVECVDNPIILLSTYHLHIITPVALAIEKEDALCGFEMTIRKTAILFW